VLQQAAPYADRLVAFCGVNPLKGYAVQETQRCARIGLRGLKLHFGNSAVDLRSPEHLESLRAVFAAANAVGFPIVVHLRTPDPSYDARDVRNFIERVLPAAPDVPVQIAHMAGYGGYDSATDVALATFVQAFDSGRLARENIYFDISGVLLPEAAREARPGTDLRTLADRQRDFPDWATRLVLRIRALGLDRVLFATDWPVTAAAEYRTLLRERLRLKPAELREILGNTAPYMGIRPAEPAASRAAGGRSRGAR